MEWEDNWYLVVGHWIGMVFTVISFLASWVYCMSEYGYLFGFGLGWIPSLILGLIVGLAVKLLWGPAIVLAGAFAALVFS